MPPTRIVDRYEVLRAVGHGGMGTVWLCRDDVLGREVAVKQVGALPGESASDVNRALREARSSAALNHPNVVSVFDAIEDGDDNWLVMEYVASRTLAEIIAADGPLTPERVAWIGAQAADGLAAAHARGTMHRDVKPSNILVTDADHVKITDFGISRTHGDPRLTRTGLVTGTPAYFAPELARGEEPGLPADVWGLGASLYGAVEGHALYPDRTNAIALLTQIATQAAPPPTRAGFLTETLNRMLDRDPDTRWSMEDAAHSLHRLHQRHSPSLRRSPTAALTPVSTPLPVPDPEPAPTPDPVPTPAPVPQPAAPLSTDPTRERPITTAPDDRRRRGGLLWLAALAVLVLLAGGGYLLTQRGDDQDPVTAGSRKAGAGSTRTPGSESTSDPGEQTSSAPDETPTDDTSSATEETSPDVPATTDAVGFIEDYYALLPGDTASAWQLLSEDYRSRTTYDDYAGFWQTIDAVSVDDAVESDTDTVEVSLTYTSADGQSESETRQIDLEATDGSFAIADDAAVAS